MKSTALLCLLLLACGSDDGGGGGGGDAEIVLSGAQSATLPALAVGGKLATDSFSTVGVSALNPAAPYTSASISFRLAGTLSAGTYPVSAVQVGVLEVSTSDGKSWTAYNAPVIGSIGTLTISSVEVLSTQGGTTLYTVHGSLAASMLMQAQGTVNLTMRSTF